MDLTGTWRADIVTRSGVSSVPVIRYVRQFGDCIWWEETDADEFPGVAYRRLFFGSLQADFTIGGQFGEIFTVGGQCDPSGESRFSPFGREVWRVEITTSGDDELITLAGPSRESDPLTGTFDTWVFSRVDTSTEAP